MLVYGLAVVVFGLDQFIKYVVRTTMVPFQEIPIWPHVLVLDYIRNPGAAWGMFGHQRWLLIGIALVVIAVVVYVKTKYRLGRVSQIALGLVLGGALGNLADRILYGKVIDYIYVQIINYPVFNLADSAIVVGVLLLLLYAVRSGPRTNTGAEDRE